MKPIGLIMVPYHLGHRGVGMGAGPARLLEAGADRGLKDAGHEGSLATVECADPPQHEVGAAFRLNTLLAEVVREVARRGEFPLVLAGNCNSCLGTLAGLDAEGVGITWFDAHGDFNTPETSESGFFDGMALNIATGGSWTAAARGIPGFTPVPQRTTALIGVRDLDPSEVELLNASAVAVAPNDATRVGDIKEWLSPHLDAIGKHAESVYVHVDLDVLDRDDVPANEYSPAGGLKPEELDQALATIGDRFTVLAAALTAYNPEVDGDGRAAGAALGVIERLAEIQ